MCIVCIELGKGTITKKEALKAFPEVVLDKQDEIKHAREKMKSIYEEEINETLVRLYGPGPWHSSQVEHASEVALKELLAQ